MDSLIGRGPLLAEALGSIDSSRMIVLIGPPGVGKSSLARAVEFAHAPHHPVLWCDLTHTTTALGMLEALATPMGLATYDVQDPSSLALALRALEGRTLVTLDNLESVQSDPAVPQVLALLRDQAPGVAWLVTSRELPSWDLPHQVLPVAPLDAQDALELFLARARIERARLSEGHLADVQSLVDALDRLPLTIELAATRAYLLDPSAIEARLRAHRFELLASPGGVDLTTSITRSWEQLTPQERAGLIALSMFQGEVGVNLAERMVEVCVPEARALDLLDALGRRSLLSLRRGPAGLRVRLLATIRDYARSQATADQREKLADRRSDVVAGWARSIWEQWLLPEGYALARAARRERAHLEATVERERSSRPALAIDAAILLQQHYIRVGPAARLRWLSEMLERDFSPSDLPDTHRILLHLMLAESLLLQPQIDRHRPREHAHAMLAALGEDRTTLQETWLALRGGQLLVYLGDEEGAQAAFALLEREHLHAGWRAFFLGHHHMLLGELEEAAEHLQQAVFIQRTDTNALYLIETVHFLSTVLHYLGRHRDLVALIEDTHERTEPDDDYIFTITSNNNLANAYHVLGEDARVDELSRDTITFAHRTGHPAHAIGATTLRVRLHIGRGELEAAEQLLSQAATLNANHHYYKESYELLLGMIALLRGSLAQGAAHVERSLELIPKFPRGRDVISQCYRAVIASIQGREDDAREALARAHAARDLVPGRRVLIDLATRLCDGQPPPTVGHELFERMLLAVYHENVGAPLLRIGPQEHVYTLEHAGARTAVDLSRRGPMKRILHELVARHRRGLGPVEVFDLVRIGWPDASEDLDPILAAARVYNNIARLRATGLDAILLKVDDGYMLDPHTALG